MTFTAGEQAQHSIRQQATSPIWIIRRHSCSVIFSLCRALVGQCFLCIPYFNCGINCLLVNFVSRKLNLRFGQLIHRTPVCHPQCRVDRQRRTCQDC